MIKKKIYIIILSFLIILEFSSMFLCYKSFSKKEIKKQETVEFNNLFAILYEEENGNYKENKNYSGFNIPGYIFNDDKSFCYGEYNSTLNKDIDYKLDYNQETKKIEVSSKNKSIYCNVYFDKGPGLKIKDNMSSTMVNDLYRFLADAGNYNQVSNYICFGTSNKQNCIDNQHKYMYRIIGVSESGLLKVIKKEALESGIQWAETSTERIPWNMSSAFNLLNGSAFLENETYIPSQWSEKIVSVDWKYGNMEQGLTTTDYYGVESSFTDVVNAKIGLLYMSDYEPGGTNYVTWIDIRNNDSSAPTKDEWTIQEYFCSGNACAFTMGESGKNVIAHAVNEALSVRPVFYIKNSLVSAGTGAISDPYLIN